jgi:predicted nucleic acid-binding protein
LSAAFVDSSCLVAILLGEPPGTRTGRIFRRYDRLFASNLLEAEVCAAARRERVVLARPSVFQDLLWVLPDRALGVQIDRVLDTGYLRGADVWHLACALLLRDRIPELEFLTLDEPQAALAGALGFPTPLAR